ncbi:MAG: hypothetical protein M3N25_09525 [Actinomycetota bacterium]|nr:hypothetical protein [Actinomycetota bacterium]MDP9021024.1 hypothetical protein [Actinomycetota bacterium]
MRALRVLAVPAVVLLVAVVAGAYASGTEQPSMTPAEAREFTTRALQASDVRNVTLGTEVREETFRPEGGEPIPVYVVPAEVSGYRLELYVQRSGDRAVNLDDAIPNGGYVLDDEQFEKLAQFRFDPAAERVAESRRGPATVAGALVLVVGVALLISVVGGRSRTAPSPSA